MTLDQNIFNNTYFAFFQKCDILHLNVGGWKFTTTLSTLCAEKGSVLEKMFSDDFTLSRDSEGAVFIDRSGEYFKFILDYLRGSIAGIDDILFDENTRKKLIKEAEYYQLEGMKNVLAFKTKSVKKKEDCDCKAEIIEIIENVIQNKEAIRNVLDESNSIERNVPHEGNFATIENLKLKYNHVYRKYETTISTTFENKIWDRTDFKSSIFQHNIIFKHCSFINASFSSCQFDQNVIVFFHGCDLINTSFDSSNFRGKVYFDESDIRFASFATANCLVDKIQNGTVTFARVKHADAADFGNKAINAVIKLLNKLD